MSQKTRLAVEKIHKKSTSTMGKRQFLRTLSSVGFATTSAMYLSPEDVAAAASDEVPVIVGFDSEDDPTNPEPVHQTVPADWYNNLQHARNVLERRIDSIRKKPGVRAAWIKPGKLGGENAKIEVNVLQSEADKGAGEIPESLEGVPTEINTVRGFNLCYNDGHYPDPVPGSVKVSTVDGSGTLGGRMYDSSSGTEVFMTAAHLWDSDPPGQDLYQPTDSYPSLGTANNWSCGLDVAIVDPNNGHDPARAIEDSIADTDSVTGWYTRDGVSTLDSEGRLIAKYGLSTGLTRGEIDGIGTTWFYGCYKEGQVKWGTAEEDFTDGDSGALAHYWEANSDGSYNYDNAWVVSICNARTTDYGQSSPNYVWGSGSWKIVNELGYTF
jgi:hypothetical protein